MLALCCLYCFVLVPLSLRFATDVVYASTALPTVIEMIYDTVEVIAISLAYAVVIYSIYRYTLSESTVTIVIFCLVTLFKYISNLAMDWINYGIDTDELPRDLLLILLPLLLEILQFMLVVWIANRVMVAHRAAVQKKLSLIPSEDRAAVDTDRVVYPFSGIVNMKNPIMRCAFFAGVVIIVTSVVQSVPYYFMVTFISGFPVLSVISQILTAAVEGVVCYLCIILLHMLFFEQKTKRTLYGE